jgi:hypothetical protein
VSWQLIRQKTKDCAVALDSVIVCYACNLEAQNLGLKTDEVRKPSIAEDRINPIEFILDDAFYPQ